MFNTSIYKAIKKARLRIAYCTVACQNLYAIEVDDPLVLVIGMNKTSLLI